MEYNESKNNIRVFSTMWGRTEGVECNFERLRHEIWPCMCAWIVFKFSKNETMSENHKIYLGIMISYVEAVVKNWEGFTQVVTDAPYKSKHLRRRSIELRRINSDFESKWRTNRSLTSRLFVCAIDNLWCLMP